MQYYTNQELAEANHVSVRTVRNWIDSARDGKLELAIHTKGERRYIANTTRNAFIIKQLVDKNKKYRPHRAQKTVMPQSKFYELYTQEQLYDIVANLEINREIPCQYNYFGDGAKNWDNYIEHLAAEESENALKAVIELLRLNRDYLDKILADYEQVNVIDVGVGNALPVREFLTYLQDQGKLGRYIALDISPTMLDIAQKNIYSWFGDSIKFESHRLDVEHDRFGYLLADEYIKSNSKGTSNILLFLGGTIANFKKPGTLLDVIHDSMGVNDFLIHQQKVDSPSTRRYFDFNPGQTNTALAPIDRYIFDLLNIDESLYTVEMGYDKELNERYIRVVLNIALSIKFAFQNGERTIDFNKGDHILLWRARHYNVGQVIDQLSAHNIIPMQISQHPTIQTLISISRINQEQK